MERERERERHDVSYQVFPLHQRDPSTPQKGKKVRERERERDNKREIARER